MSFRKPLILSQFPAAVKMHQDEIERILRQHGATNGTSESAGPPMCNEADKWGGEVTGRASTQQVTCSFLLSLTPSITTLPKWSKSSGRFLSELATLHVKFKREYHVLLPTLTTAIAATVKAHAALRRAASPGRSFLWGEDDKDKSYIAHSTGVELTHRSMLSSRENRSVATRDTVTTAGSTGLCLISEEASGGAMSSALHSCNRLSPVTRSFVDEETGERLYEVDLGPPSFARFITTAAHSTSFGGLVERIIKYTLVSPSVLLIACLYLDRLLLVYPSLRLHSHNIHLLYLTSVRTASKVFDTRTISNHSFATVGFVDSGLLSDLETIFVQQLKFHLYVPPQELLEYAAAITGTVPTPLPSGEAMETTALADPRQRQPIDSPQPQRRLSESAHHATCRGARSVSLQSQTQMPLRQGDELTFPAKGPTGLPQLTAPSKSTNASRTTGRRVMEGTNTTALRSRHVSVSCANSVSAKDSRLGAAQHLPSAHAKRYSLVAVPPLPTAPASVVAGPDSSPHHHHAGPDGMSLANRAQSQERQPVLVPGELLDTPPVVVAPGRLVDMWPDRPSQTTATGGSHPPPVSDASDHQREKCHSNGKCSASNGSSHDGSIGNYGRATFDYPNCLGSHGHEGRTPPGLNDNALPLAVTGRSLHVNTKYGSSSEKGAVSMLEATTSTAPPAAAAATGLCPIRGRRQ